MTFWAGFWIGVFVTCAINLIVLWHSGMFYERNESHNGESAAIRNSRNAKVDIPENLP